MTSGEAIAELKRDIELDNDFTEDYLNAVNMAIKALKQHPVLDKIRAEIEKNSYPIVHGVNNHEKGMTLYGILQIIDKYKSEMEDEE